MMEAFEAQNRVRILLTATSCLTSGQADIKWQAQAIGEDAGSSVAPVLASASVTCLAGRLRTMEGLITFLLYQLDFQLAEHEWQKNAQAE